MKSVGIITVHCADNFGALLQTYGLKRYVENLGYETKVINYCPAIITDQYPLLFYKGEIRAGINSGLKCLWRSVIYVKFKNLPKMISKKKKMKSYRKNNLDLTRKVVRYKDLKKLEQFDYYITGSDQLWNPDITGLDDAYFLSFVPDDQYKIAYAVSTGKNLSEDEKRAIADKADTFKYVSLREKTSVEELHKYFTQNICQTADPSLLLSEDEWSRLAVRPKDNDKYILFYSLFFTKEQFETVNYLSDMTGYKVKHFFYGRLAKRLHRNGGSFYYAGVEEFLGLIKNAEYVVTDSFHCSVFSMIFRKKFCVVMPPERSVRLRDLIALTHMENRVMGDDIQSFDWDWNNSETDYSQLDFPSITVESREFICNALEYRKEI